MGNITNSAERKANRSLLIVYDLIVYYLVVAVFLFLYNRKPVNSLTSFLTLILVLPIFLTTARLLMHVYLQIWRNPAVSAFARLFTADIIGGGTFILIVYVASNLAEWFSYYNPMYIVLIVVVDIFALTCVRIAYYYLYKFAESKAKLSKLAKKLLERFGLVDFSAKDEGGVLHVVLESEHDNREPINDILAIFYRFNVVGRVVDVKRNNAGYINRTYKITTLSEHDHKHTYILQRINTKVFPDADALMENYMFTVNHLKDKLHLQGQASGNAVAMVKETREGKPYLKDVDGCWRVMNCYNDVFSLDIPNSTEVFHDAGQAFGAFIYAMSDVDPKRIYEVIPNFHNTLSRYKDLCKVIEADPVGRVKNVSEEIAFVKNHEYIYNIIAEKFEKGIIPIRVCHNDTNLNNILFDNETNKPVAIIDLDTVMPSTPLYDFGDSMRIGTNTAKDDETDLSKVSCDLDMYRAYASGWLKSCGKILTREELNLLPYACLVITSEDGIRFLMDHINGDIYYNIFYPRQNLDRSRTQLALLADMERKLPQIKQILKEIYEELKLDGDPFAYDFSANEAQYENSSNYTFSR